MESRPYNEVANEILHWCSLSQEEFRGKVDEQVAVAMACNELQQFRKLPRNFQIKSDLQRSVLAKLISAGW